MTVIVDYGVGNLFSLCSSLALLGENAVVTADPALIRESDRMILPGVGAFGDASEKLKRTGLDRVVIEEAKNKKPLLGICLGMQLLFDKSYEYGEYDGLGLIRGTIRPIADAVGPGKKIPHIGWNALDFVRPSPLFQYIKNGDYVYFVHSYYAAECSDSVIASTDYGAPLTAAVASGSVYGCQFHPEKSGEVGLNILRAFCEVSS